MITVPKQALDQHIAILGKTGSGKTCTGKLCVEQVVADCARVCILDPIKSDWWGLTSSANGRREGLPFQILGGPRGHVSLHEAAGKAVGDVAASGALPLSIIDMANFGRGGIQKFFVDFAPALIRKMKGVLYLVIEEAHEFAPKERSNIGAETESIYWAKKLATAGRSKGIRLIVLTQRTQALHNALLGSCDTIIAHRLTAPADQKPVVDWLKANTDKQTADSVSKSLASLKTGEGWLCSGEAQLFERRTFPKITTYDNSRTPTDSDGEHHVKTATVDADQLKSIIGDAVKDAEANDPALLRKRIAELEKQLRDKPTVQVDQDAIDRAVAARDREYAAALKERDSIIGSLTGRMGKAVELLSVNGEAVAKTVVAPKAFTNQVNHSQPARPQKSYQKGKPSEAIAVSSGITLPQGEAAVLRALIQYPDGLDRSQLTVLTGYKRSSRDAYIARLASKGLIEVRGGQVHRTDEGLSALPDAEPLPTGQALQEYWLDRLPQGEAAILRHLIDAMPVDVSRDDLTEATGYKRSSRDAYIARLKAKQLVVDSHSGVQASPTLFGVGM